MDIALTAAILLAVVALTAAVTVRVIQWLNER